MAEYLFYVICGLVSFAGIAVTVGVSINKKWLILTIGIPVLLWSITLPWLYYAWENLQKQGGFQQVWSTTAEISDKTLKNGGTIQIIEYERNQDIIVVNVTKIFGRTFDVGTKIRVFEKEFYVISCGIGFCKYKNESVQYEVLEKE